MSTGVDAVSKLLGNPEDKSGLTYMVKFYDSYRQILQDSYPLMCKYGKYMTFEKSNRDITKGPTMKYSDVIKIKFDNNMKVESISAYTDDFKYYWYYAGLSPKSDLLQFVDSCIDRVNVSADKLNELLTNEFGTNRNMIKLPHFRFEN